MAERATFIVLITVLVAIFITLQGCRHDDNGQSTDVKKAFDDFIKTHGKQYDDAERKRRFQQFTINAKKVDELNGKEDGTATYSMRGPFADWHPDEFAAKRLLPEDVLRKQIQGNLRRRLSPECPKCTGADLPLLDTSSLPTSFDWRTQNAVGPVQKQLCNECWAFAATAHLESAHVVQAGGAFVKFSEQQAIDCSTGSCSAGGQSFNVFRNMVNTNDGLSTLAQYPYRGECAGCDSKSAAHGCSATKGGPKVRDWGLIAWAEKPNNEDQMAAAVVKYGPIVASVNASGLQFYANKVTKPITGSGSNATCATSTNHIVVIV